MMSVAGMVSHLLCVVMVGISWSRDTFIQVMLLATDYT